MFNSCNVSNQHFCIFSPYTPEGNVSKAIPIALSTLGALGAILIGLGLSGYLPLYAATIGATELTTVCIAGVFCYLYCSESNTTVPTEKTNDEHKQVQLFYDVLVQGVFPRLS